MFFTLFSLLPPKRWRSMASMEFFAVGACPVVLYCVDWVVKNSLLWKLFPLFRVVMIELLWLIQWSASYRNINSVWWRSLSCPDHLSGVTRLEKTVMRTSYFSHISSSTWILASSFWRMWAWFAARWRVILAVAIWLGALTPNATVLGGDVGEGLLSCALTPIKHGSWFQHTNLTFQEVMFLTHIIRREPAGLIKQKHRFGPTTLAGWGQFCTEVMLVYMQGCSEKVGGPNKTVEIDKNKFGVRKYGRAHPVKGQWVFGGVERESGRTFLVPVPDKTADTLMAVIDTWIEPDTTVISDCWGAYRHLDTRNYTHHTVNHSIEFVDQRTGAHTNTIESTWRHVKA